MARESPSSSGSGRQRPLPPGDPTAPPVRGYTLVRRIGAGSYGEVWLGYGTVGRWHAVKIVRRDAFDSKEPYQRELRGLRAYVPVSEEQPDLLRIFHAEGTDDERCFYYVMELGDARKPVAQATSADSKPQAENAASSGHEGDWEWDDYAARTLKTDLAGHQPLPCTRCLEVTRKVATALGHLHARGLVHRDVKPSNIVFVRNEPKLADIGLVAKMEQSLSVSRVGAAGYMPEEGAGTPSGDLYALGKILYEMATGYGVDRFPVLPSREEAGEYHRGILELNRVILKACATRPKDRYQNAEETLEDLALLESGRSLRRSHRIRRALKLVGLGAATAAGLIGIAAGIVLLSQRSTIREQERELLVQRLLMKWQAEHTAGWSDEMWRLAEKAADIRRDQTLRDHATTMLTGVDARLAERFTNFGGSSVAFDAEGKRLLIGGVDGNSTMLWENGQVRASSVSNAGPVGFAQDGTPLQLCAGSGAVVLWNLSGRRMIREFTLPASAEVYSNSSTRLPILALSGNGALAAGSMVLSNGQGKVAVWEVESGRLLGDFDGKASSLAFAPDNSLFAAGDENGAIVVRSLPDGQPVFSLTGEPVKIWALAFARDPFCGSGAKAGVTNWLLAAGDSGSMVTVWEVPGGRLRSRCQGSPFDVYALAFSPDGMTLASGGRYAVRIWDIATAKLLLTLGDGDYAMGLAYAPDGRRLAVSTKRVWANGMVAVWGLEFGRGIDRLHGLSAQVMKVCLSADGRMLAALAHNWQVAVWDLGKRQLRHGFEVPQGVSADHGAMLFSADGGRFVFSAGMEAGMWDMTSGARLNSWRLPPGYLDGLVHDATGRRLLFRFETVDRKEPPYESDPVLHPRVVRVWHLRMDGACEELSVVTNFNARGICLVPCGDGSHFAVEGQRIGDRPAEFSVGGFDVARGRDLWPKEGLSESALVSDPNGGMVAFYEGKSAAIVELATGRLRRRVRGGVVALSPEGRDYVLQASDGNRAWGDLFVGPNQRSVVSLGLHLSQRGLPQFSSRGDTVVWGDTDGGVCIHALPEIRRRLGKLGLGW